jgi:hypothetical protein
MVPNMIRMILSDICQKSKTIMVLVVCFSQPPELKWLPHTYKSEPLLKEPYGSMQKYMEEMHTYIHTQQHSHEARESGEGRLRQLVDSISDFPYD